MRDLTGLDAASSSPSGPSGSRCTKLLVRVTADFSVPDGARDRGPRHQFPPDRDARCSRGTSSREIDAIRAAYDALRRQLAAIDRRRARRAVPRAGGNARRDGAIAARPPARALRARPAPASRRRPRRRCRGRGSRRVGGAGARRRRRDAHGRPAARWRGSASALARAPRPALGRPRHDRGARHRPRLQRATAARRSAG